MGRVIALALAEAGVDIVVHYGGSADAAQATAAEIEAMGQKAFVVQADIGDWACAQSLGKQALAHFGKVDILINSASSFVAKRYFDTSEADFDYAFDVNIKGQFALSQVIAEAMMAREHAEGEYSNIINIVDEGAFFPWSNAWRIRCRRRRCWH